MIRKIVEISKEKCSGCGECAKACHEGAIQMKDGVAVLIKDDYCDGLGDCLPACPSDAIRIIEREAADYDADAVAARMAENAKGAGVMEPAATPCTMARTFEKNMMQEAASTPQVVEHTSRLAQWPCQIKLVPLRAPYYENANLLVAADCTAFAYADFHERFMKNHVTLVGCPKLDAVDYSEKLTEIIKQNSIKSVKVLRMEVPCCGGLEAAVVRALKDSGKMIPWQVVTISCDGRILEG